MRILASLLLAGVVLGCFGCASSQRHGAAADWQDPDTATPLSLLATQGISSRIINDRLPSGTANKARVVAETGSNISILPQTNRHYGPPAPTGLVSLKEWCRKAGVAGPIAVHEVPAAFTISNAAGQLKLSIGSQVADWQGMDIHLGYAPVLIQNQIYAQSADIRSTLAPLLRPPSASPLSGNVIVLDPGHGGPDSGTSSSQGAREKDYTLDLARRLKGLLEADKWEVYLTRSTDMEVALSNRVAVADSANASLFLSLHFNSAPPDKRGLETYCLTPAGVPSTLTRGYADELDLTLPNNDFDAQNIRIAVMIHRALLNVNEGRDRGVRRARFPTVLRGQKRPAVLVEAGYLSNSAEARKIADGGYRQKMAEAIASTLRPFSPATANGGNEEAVGGGL